MGALPPLVYRSRIGIDDKKPHGRVGSRRLDLGRVLPVRLPRGDVDAVSVAIALGEKIDASSTFRGYTALHVSIVKKDLPMFERLLELEPTSTAEASGVFTQRLSPSFAGRRPRSSRPS